MIIMDYCYSIDLAHYITNKFYNTSWSTKLNQLFMIAISLKSIHKKNIIHHDFHVNLQLNYQMIMKIMASFHIWLQRFFKYDYVGVNDG